MWSSFHSPRSCGVIRPSGSTASASVRTSPAPPTARLPKCTRCQSLLNPSSLEYWHMGETNTRLGKLTPANWMEENNSDRFVDKMASLRTKLSSTLLLSRCTGQAKVAVSRARWPPKAFFGEHVRADTRTFREGKKHERRHPHNHFARCACGCGNRLQGESGQVRRWRQRKDCHSFRRDRCQ